MKQGFTLIEIIVAASILIAGIVGMAIVISSIISIFSIFSSRLVAAYLTQEGVEIVRNIRDTNWLENRRFGESFALCSGGCEADYTTGTSGGTNLRVYNANRLNIDNNNFYSYSSGNPTEYQRKITVEQIDNDILRVIVDVFWKVKGKSYELSAEEYLYNWR